MSFFAFCFPPLFFLDLGDLMQISQLFAADRQAIITPTVMGKEIVRHTWNREAEHLRKCEGDKPLQSGSVVIDSRGARCRVHNLCGFAGVLPQILYDSVAPDSAAIGRLH